MSLRYDVIPRHPIQRSLVVTTPRPPYRAPTYDVPPMHRPRALVAGGGGVQTDAHVLADATSTPPAAGTPGSGTAASGSGCGCPS